MVILLNEQTMPRMTVTGERVVSPITDPINRNTDAAKQSPTLSKQKRARTSQDAAMATN